VQITRRGAKALRRGLALLATLSMLGGVTACSGSDDSADKTGSGGASGSPIVLGQMASLSGALSVTASSVKAGLDAWVGAVNASGGINGHPVKVVTLDDQGSATVGLQNAKKLIQQEKVVALVGQASGSVETWEKLVEQAGIPVVGGQTSETPFMTNPDFFSTGPSVLAIQYGVAKLASTQGPKFGYVYCAEAPVCAQSQALLSALGGAVNLDVAAAMPASSTAPDYTAQCQKLKSTGVDGYGLGLVSDTALRVASACRTQGLDAPVVISDGTMTAQWLTEHDVDGTLVAGSAAPYVAAETPAEQAFQAALKKYPSGNGAQIGPNTMSGWLSGKLLEAAIAASGSDKVTSDSIKKGLYSLKDETLGGLSVPLNYTEGKPNPVNCSFQQKIEGGTLKQVSSTPVCAPAELVAKIASGS
jgi:branched-chain amino acid transport system substrate-binding protein